MGILTTLLYYFVLEVASELLNISLIGNSVMEDAANTKLVIVAVIPAYNESRSIANIISETAKYVTSIVVVDDGSRDNTTEVAESCGVKVRRHMHNIGKGAALKTGFIECLKQNPDFVITIDADGQHDPSEIPKLLKPLQEGQADVVIGSRYINSSSTIPTYRKAGLSFITFLDKHLAKTSVKDSQSGFRAYSRKVLPIISAFSSTGFGVESEQLAIMEQYGLTVLEVPIAIKYQGLDNTSKRNPLLQGAEITSKILKIVTEKRPLLSFGIPGLVFLFSSLGTAINLIDTFNATRYFSIPMSLIVLGLALVGIMLIITAIVLYSNNRLDRKLNLLRRDILGRN
jgi:glycosyltransferase involved in cell wall biosynthesis